MVVYTLKRALLYLAVAIVVSILTFMMLRLSGDPARTMAGPEAEVEEVEFIRNQYGFDRPLYIQYCDWAYYALQGDLGDSFNLRQPVSTIIGDRMGVTMTLGVCSLCFALVLAIPLGVLAALKANTWIDRMALSIVVVGQAMPTFWCGLLLIFYFGVELQWLPIFGTDSWKHFVMPTITLGYFGAPAFMRLTRAGMMDVLASDYIRTALAKGLRPFSVLFKHGLRNAIIPVVSLAAVQFGLMLGGSVVVESVFAINGLGFLAWQSIARADLPVIQGVVLLLSLLYVTLTFIGDLLNAFLDPRIRNS